jgi:hypothetical protein
VVQRQHPFGAGLSYRYLQPLPVMDGLLVDGDDINPIIQPSADPSFTAFLPNAWPFQLRPQASTLVLEPAVVSIFHRPCPEQGNGNEC